MEPEDAVLVGRSQAGDIGAFNAIVERYQSRVFNLAARILGDTASADDTAQETFISAYRAIGRFRGGSLQGWLLRIASNASKDLIRSRRRRREDSLDNLLLNPSFQVQERGETPEQHAIRGELRTELQRAILSIPEDQRTALVMVDVQGLSYDETAEAVGVSLGTIKSRLSRARARVRDSLMERRELLPDQFRQMGDRGLES